MHCSIIQDESQKAKLKNVVSCWLLVERFIFERYLSVYRVKLTKQLLQSSQKKIWIIISIWAMAQVSCYILWGTQTGLESIKYIQAADYFLEHGNFPEKRYWFYSITIFVIAFSKWLNAGFDFVFFIQLLLSLIAHISFFKALRSQSESSNPAPLLVTATLCLILPYHQWNLTLYTESVFYSLVLLFFSSCIRKMHITIKNLLIQSALLFLVIFSRPLGILILLPWIMYLFFHAPTKIKYIIAGFGAISLLVVSSMANTILSSIGDWNVMLPFEEKSIICSSLPLKKTTPAISDINENPITQIFYFIKAYPKEFLILSYKKTKAFFLMTRDYYSAGHNLFLILLSFIFYLPILLSFWVKKIDTASIFTIIIILFFYAAVVLQCDDYHNRFILTLAPLFLYTGLFRLLKKS